MGNKTFVETKNVEVKKYSYSYSYPTEMHRRMYKRYYSYSYPIGGQRMNGHMHYFYGNGSVISETGEEEDIEVDYSYDNVTGEIIATMPGGDPNTTLNNATEEVEQPKIEEPEVVVTTEIVPEEIEVPEPILIPTYSYSYSMDYSYSKVVYGYMYSRVVSRDRSRDGKWHNIYGNGTVENDEGEIEDYSIDYEYNTTTNEITVDLGDESTGETINEIPEEVEAEIPKPEVEVIETLTPVVPEEPIVPGEPPVLPEPIEEEGCASMAKPKYNYTYSYDTSYSTSYDSYEKPDGTKYEYSYSYPIYNDITTNDYDDEYDMEAPVEGDGCPCELTAESSDISEQVQEAVAKQAKADAAIISELEGEVINVSGEN
jgi:hypothetical protein